ncbi:MAG: tetratricopeptide repeat-containing sensor histidine kinase [Marinilabiliaceae bacterium]|nr:tetratricopeptide repeat-containing sensor histidine kinase [Marinilabiliaceae bacterium]
MCLVLKKRIVYILIIFYWVFAPPGANIMFAQTPNDSISFCNTEELQKQINIFLTDTEKEINSKEQINKGILLAKKALSLHLKNETDSILSKCLKATNNDNFKTHLPELLFLYGKLLNEKHSPDKAIEYFSKSLDISSVDKNNDLTGNIYNNIGVSYWYQRNYPQALDFFDKAMDYAIKNTNESLRLKTLTNKGIVYSQFANYTKAIECLLLANELASQTKNQNIEANSLNSLGNIYIQTQQYEKALESYTNAKKIFIDLNDSTGISICLNNIGEVYLNLNNTALALENFFNSLSIQESRKDTLKIATVNVNIGNTHFKSGQFRYAIKYYQDALKLITETHDISLYADIKYHLGLTLIALNNFELAENYLTQASTVANKIGEKEKEANCLLALSELFEKQNSYKNALYYKNKYAEIKDKIINDKTIEYMARMDAIYRSIKKEKIIQELIAEKKVNDHLFLKEKNKRKIFLLTSAFLGLITIILFLAFFLNQKVNRRISVYNKKLQNLNATKDKFFSIISHDLKSPINSILGFSEMLVLHAESNNTKDLHDYAQMVHSNSKKLYALVDNLLLWSRTQVGSTQYTPEKLDVSIQCNNIISLLRLSSEEKDILISGKIEKRLEAFADVNLFNTILRNLISNAIKFSKVGGSIVVSAKRNHEMVEISVADSGVGISQENLEKLFRIDSNISTKGTFNEKGSGLGLILCKEFVEINKGKIWAESELEKGSTFYFTVPLAK